jgi:hypothetical protein
MTTNDLTKTELKTIIIKQGEFYGYPSCCTRSFCRFFINRDKYPRDPIQNKNAHAEGFVPCLKHAKLLSNKKIILRDLIQNRVCSMTFMFDNYMNSDNFRRGMEFCIQINGEFERWLIQQNLSSLSKKYHDSRSYNQKNTH